MLVVIKKDLLGTRNSWSLGVTVQSENSFHLTDFVGDSSGRFVEVGEYSVERSSQVSHNLLVSVDLVLEPRTKVLVYVPPEVNELNDDGVIPPRVFASGLILLTLLILRVDLRDTHLLPLLKIVDAYLSSLDTLAFRSDLR